jgi:hypothetical protein
MLEALAGMLAQYDGWYIARCELRHLLASLLLVGLPLLVAYRTSTMRSLGRGTSMLPSWWWLGLWLGLGLALGVTLHYAIDFDLLKWLFPTGWA